ncbi:hypothetical protein C4K24_3452 [Pseudomonas chlororaphis subsp. aurantiaca]|nr:hypothetical protein C4K24_3452 [Pseudomonas chlororaphis subsp. aurantiaca]
MIYDKNINRIVTVNFNYRSFRRVNRIEPFFIVSILGRSRTEKNDLLYIKARPKLHRIFR